ncbi:MAG: lysine--tRNA ligase [Chlamydiia bacterium]
MQHSEEYLNRLRKLEEIRGFKIEPFPAASLSPILALDLAKKYHGHPVGNSEDGAEGKTQQVEVAGRVVLFRAMGKNAFLQLLDENQTIQVMLNKDLTKVDGLQEDPELTGLKFIEKYVDLGDFLSVKGNVFRTKVGELTVYAKEVTFRAKALLPLPDKHGGLSDIEMRYRKRWLDLISNPNILTTFQKRSKIVSLMRRYYEDQGFIEVETPVLQSIYGGANASPFITHVNALHINVFLRISLEIQLKKLIVGGLRKVFEMSKVFRNEGLDRTHNPEFTMVESYAAYQDYHDVMDFTEGLFIHLAQAIHGTTNLGERQTKQGTLHHIDLKGPWKRYTMKESIRVYKQIDVDQKSDQELRDILKDTPLDPAVVKKLPRGLLIAKIFEEFVEEHLIEPHFIIDHPVETTPLCKMHRNLKEKEEGIVERFELFMLGMEMANAYSELNDPILQEKLLRQQQEAKDAGDEEAHPMDEEFIEALNAGMPPTGGLGIGVDRLVMVLTGEVSIRDVVYFPMMKPQLIEKA